jgi:hypothetical protein
MNQSREHVLADTALSREQHLDVARGDASGHADGVFHRGTRPDDGRSEWIRGDEVVR